MTTTPERPPEDPVPSTAPGPSPDAVETAELVDQDVLSDAAGILDDAAERDLEPADLAAMDALDSPRRLLLVHAHPDDETIANGATMARYASAGAHVTLVTCTRGERGEVVEPSLAHLQGDGAALAAHRTMELATAMEALGVEDHRFLDDAHLASEDATAAPAAHYEDSGMVWGEGGRVAVAAPDTGPDAFSRADPREAATRLAGLLRAERPQVLVTYEAGGGYGHPDHVRAHDVAVLAVALAADPASADVAGSEPWTVAKVYETVLPRSALAQLGAGGAEAGAGPGAEGRGAMSMVVDDDEVTAVVDAPEQRAAKAAALRAHASQVRFREAPPGVPGPFQFSVGQDVWLPVTTTEHYRLRADSPAPAAPGEGGVETDLFAGVAL